MSLRTELLENSLLEYQNNIFYQKGLPRKNSFEAAYLKLRQGENRIQSDEGVSKLPQVLDGHPNKGEWEMRKSTLQQLIRHLKGSKTKNVLELGCGNGWLANSLSISLKAEICGVDVNELELLQAGRVFGGRNNLCFVYANIFEPIFKDIKFDAVVLGGSIQYFRDLSVLLITLLDMISSSGTIYIADSPLYISKFESLEAKKRSHQHFQALGFPEMIDQYHHHTFAELRFVNYKILYEPTSIVSLVKRKILNMPLSVFPIICITK